MKIDTTQGTVSFERGEIHRTLDLPTFLATQLGQTARKSLANESWTHYDIDPEDGVLGTVLFNGQSIDRIFLAMKLRGESADDWSVERELERKSMHEKWLHAALGEPPYQYPWGRVVSEFDAKGLASEIIIVYEP